MSLALKKLLFDEYDGFAYKRYKALTNDAPFAVDDRGAGTYDAKGDFFLWFCALYVRVGGKNTFQLTVTRAVPLPSAVEKLAAKKGGSVKQEALRLVR